MSRSPWPLAFYKVQIILSFCLKLQKMPQLPKNITKKYIYMYIHTLSQTKHQPNYFLGLSLSLKSNYFAQLKLSLTFCNGLWKNVKHPDHGCSFITSKASGYLKHQHINRTPFVACRMVALEACPYHHPWVGEGRNPLPCPA